MNQANLIRAVEQAIGLLRADYRGQAAESDLYEASLLALAVEAARTAGGTCLLTSDGRTSAKELVFRRGPGNLWLGIFTYALATFPNVAKCLEIHLGVYVLCPSGVAHECDVAILDHAEAERSRNAAVHPRRKGLVTAIEAKNYAASPGLGIGRAFLGLASELGHKNCKLAFPAASSANIAALIAKRDSEIFDELIPGTAAAERLRSHLDQKIRNWRASS